MWHSILAIRLEEQAQPRAQLMKLGVDWRFLDRCHG
jgi:hypothetical protein